MGGADAWSECKPGRWWLGLTGWPSKRRWPQFLLLPPDAVTYELVAQLVERDTGRPRGVGQQRQRRQARDGVDLQQPGRAVRGDYEVHPCHPIATEHPERPRRRLGGGLPRLLGDPSRDYVVASASGVLGVIVVRLVVVRDLQGWQHADFGRCEDADRDLGARHEPLNHHPAVIPAREHQAARQGVHIVGDGQADGRSLPHWLDHQRQAIPISQILYVVAFALFELRNHQALCAQYVVGAGFVDAKSAGQDARSGVWQPEQLEHSLDGAVFAQPAVERDENAVVATIAQAVPNVQAEVDLHDFVAALSERVRRLYARAQGNLTLGRSPTLKDRDLHWLHLMATCRPAPPLPRARRRNAPAHRPECAGSAGPPRRRSRRPC